VMPPGARLKPLPFRAGQTRQWFSTTRQLRPNGEELSASHLRPPRLRPDDARLWDRLAGGAIANAASRWRVLSWGQGRKEKERRRYRLLAPA
jgi:hypothetical protein